MKTDIKQDTPEWLALKETKIGMSEIGSILGVGRLTPFQMWEKKLYKTTTPLTAAMADGKRLEPVARKILEEELGYELENPVFIHDELNFMMASLDAYNEKKSLLAEIKVGPRVFEDAEKGIISPEYFAQVQGQIEITDLESAIFAVMHPETRKLIILDIYRDTKYIKSLKEAAGKFWESWQTITPPELSEKDYEPMTSLEWKQNCPEWFEVCTQLKKLEARKEALRAEFIALAGERNAKGFGVTVSKIIRPGNIDYKSIPELKKIDLEKFRKSPITMFRVS